MGLSISKTPAGGFKPYVAYGTALHLQYLVAVMVDGLHRDLAFLWHNDRQATCRVPFRPFRLIGFRLHRTLELVGWLAAARFRYFVGFAFFFLDAFGSGCPWRSARMRSNRAEAGS